MCQLMRCDPSQHAWCPECRAYFRDLDRINRLSPGTTLRARDELIEEIKATRAAQERAGRSPEPAA